MFAVDNNLQRGANKFVLVFFFNVPAKHPWRINKILDLTSWGVAELDALYEQDKRH